MVRPRALIAAVLVPLACHAIAGVEDKQLDPKYASGGSSGTDAGSDVEGGGGSASSARPPERPPGWPGPSGVGVRRWFAARRVFMGTIDPASPPGAPTKDELAWRKLGHDLDAKCTTLEQSISDSSGVCKKPANASSQSLEDGELCLDNAAGRLLAYGSQVLSKDFEIDVHNEMISAESATFLLELSDLDETSDDAYVPGMLYVSVPTGIHPLWDGSDQLPIDISSLAQAEGSAPDAGGVDAEAGAGSLPPSRYAFPNGYLAGNVWVSGDFNELAMPMPLFVFDRVMPVETLALNLEIELDAAHDKALGSTLSAVVSEQTLETQLQPIAYEIVGCNTLYSAVLVSQFVLPALDLANQPTDFVDATAICSAMSFGFGFDWVPVKPPTMLLPAPPRPPQCDGG